MTVLTLAQLKAVGACLRQRTLFKKLFGTSVEVTEELCVSVADHFDWSWAADYLLHGRVTEYNVVCNAAWVRFSKVSARTWTEYTKMNAAECTRVRAAAWDEYVKVRAATFGRLYAL